jgi:hypothetical protein
MIDWGLAVSTGDCVRGGGVLGGGRRREVESSASEEIGAEVELRRTTTGRDVDTLCVFKGTGALTDSLVLESASRDEDANACFDLRCI